MHIVMLLSNPFRPDPRVAKEAKSLHKSGHQVTIVCWDREARYEPQEIFHGVQIIRIRHIKTKYGTGAKQIFFTPRFWRAAYQRLKILNPDVVHCHDLDTLPAGYWFNRMFGTTLIYDAHEDYPALMSLYLPTIFVHLLSWLEKQLIRNVDQIITASSVLASKYQREYSLTPVTIGNYQYIYAFDQINSEQLYKARNELGLDEHQYVIAYIGGFSRNRLLLPLLKVAGELQDVKFFLWGDGHQRDLVQDFSQDLLNVEYLGWLPLEKVPLYTRLSDVLYYCLVPNYPGAIYNAPNSLFNAMAAGRPIIANEVGDLGHIVKSTGCGRLLAEVSEDNLVKVINELRDPAVRDFGRPPPGTRLSGPDLRGG